MNVTYKKIPLHSIGIFSLVFILIGVQHVQRTEAHASNYYARTIGQHRKKI